MKARICNGCDLPKEESSFSDTRNKKCKACCGLVNVKVRRIAVTEELRAWTVTYNRLIASTQSTEPPTWGRFCSTKMMNPWKYPEKGSYEVWVEEGRRHSMVC